MRQLAPVRYRGNHKIRNTFRRRGTSWWATHNMLKRREMAMAGAQMEAMQALADKVNQIAEQEVGIELAA